MRVDELDEEDGGERGMDPRDIEYGVTFPSHPKEKHLHRTTTKSNMRPAGGHIARGEVNEKERRVDAPR